MKRLTKRERQIVYDACEAMLNNINISAIYALQTVTIGDTLYYRIAGELGRWVGSDDLNDLWLDERVLALAFFAEYPGDD